MANDDWAGYVRRVTAGMTQVQASDTTGVAQTAISRWLRGGTDAPRAEYVVAFARALGQNPVEALIAAGYLTKQEAGVPASRSPISDYSNDELLEELGRRVVGDGR